MTSSQAIPGADRQMALFMDLLSHDILNNNQAVLSYLDLVLANPAMERRDREYAEKAISHVRASSLLVEHARNLTTRSGPGRARAAIDLVRSVRSAAKELAKFFPGKKIRVKIAKGPANAYVNGDVLAEDLVLSSFVEMVKADPGEEVVIDAKVLKSEDQGRDLWTLQVTDANAVRQPDSGLEGVSGGPQDSSTMVRMAGQLFAQMAARQLGGRFTSGAAGKDGRGAEFRLALQGAAAP